MKVDKKIRALQNRCPFLPVSDGIVIYRMEIKESAGGIVLPDKAGLSSRGFAITAYVLAVGPGKYAEQTGVHIPMPCKAGEVILITSLAGLELGEIVRSEMGSDASFESIRLIKSTDVIATINPEIDQPPVG